MTLSVLINHFDLDVGVLLLFYVRIGFSFYLMGSGLDVGDLTALWF